MLAYGILESDFLQFFADNRDYDNWDEVTLNWVIAAVVISVICTGMMMAYKWWRKKSAGVIRLEAWSRGETLVLITVGLLPVLLLTLVVYYYSRDFENVVGIGGLVKGILFSWLLYLLLIAGGHAVSAWRHELL
jgi:uncharacterized membrane protein